MKLTFKQKLISVFDSYNVYDDNDNVYFKVKGKLAVGHSFIIFDKNNEEVGKLKQKIFTFLPKYKVFINDEKVGMIRKKFTFFKPKFDVTFDNYKVEGNFLEWDYRVYKDNDKVATISKRLFNLTDTYVIDVNEEDALVVLMIVISIDSIKDRRSTHHD